MAIRVTIRVTILLAWVDFATSKSSNIWNLGTCERASGFASSGALSVLLVGCDVEGDEQ